MALTFLHICALFALSPSAFGQSPTNSKWPSQSFQSMPDDFLCPVVSWNKTAPTVPGYLFFAPIGDDADRGGFDAPTIMTDEGELVWRPTAQNVNGTRNFDLQSLNGQDVLTYWTGDHNPSYGCGYGGVQILDTSFNQMYNVCMASLPVVPIEGTYIDQPCRIDSHESRISAAGTLLVNVRNVTAADLSIVGGPTEGWLLDFVFYEIQPETEEVLFRWSAYENNHQLNMLKISSYPQAGDRNEDKPWDFFHGNSIVDVPEPLGGYIISSRYLSSAIKISSTGNIEWYLQGKTGGNFTLPDDAQFNSQHDITVSNVTASSLNLVMFDNENTDISFGKSESSGLELNLNLSSMTVTLMRRLMPNNFTKTPHTGSYQSLPQNHVLLDFGHPPILNEYDEDDHLIYIASVSSLGGETYRAYKYNFTGTPTTAPDIFVSRSDAKTQVSVSWNGATEVDAWTFSAGSACDSVTMLSQSYPKTRFETTATLDAAYDYVQAHAMAGSTVLASSLIVQVTSAGNNGSTGNCDGSAVAGKAGSPSSSVSSAMPGGTATSSSAAGGSSTSAAVPTATQASAATKTMRNTASWQNALVMIASIMLTYLL